MPLAIDIDSVKEDPKNARKHDSANITAIKQSLSTYGQRKPIVVNSETGIIEAGNGLWKAAKTWDGARSPSSRSKTTRNRNRLCHHGQSVGSFS